MHSPQGTGASRADARQPRVRLATIRHLVPVLQDLGFDAGQVLSEAGFDVSLFDDPDNWMSFPARNRCIARAVERTGCRHLGLLVGQRNDLRSLGLIGLLAKYSPDAGTALRSLVRHFDLHARGAVLTLGAQGRIATFGFESFVPAVEANDQVEDAALASAFNILRALCGPGWSATEVRFAHRKPDDVRPFRAFFGAPLLFDDEQNAVVFQSHWLQHRLPEADPDLHALLATRVESLQGPCGERFPDQVRGILRTALLTEHGSADHIAAVLSMHSRTLNRRLAVAGTSFRKLVEESRFAIACQLLKDTDANVNHVATVLNYADSSAFTRAFRRWAGTTPVAWRHDQLQQSAARSPSAR